MAEIIINPQPQSEIKIISNTPSPIEIETGGGGVFPDDYAKQGENSNADISTIQADVADIKTLIGYTISEIDAV